MDHATHLRKQQRLDLDDTISVVSNVRAAIIDLHTRRCEDNPLMALLIFDEIDRITATLNRLREIQSVLP